jgi:hypothetical protein
VKENNALMQSKHSTVKLYNLEENIQDCDESMNFSPSEFAARIAECYFHLFTPQHFLKFVYVITLHLYLFYE